MTTTPNTLKVGSAAAAIVAAAMAFIRPWEGYVPHPYHDGTGHDAVCRGHTVPYSQRHYDTSECAAFFVQDVWSAYKDVDAAIHVPLTVSQWIALVDFQFNTGAIWRSSVRKQANSGRPASVWCHSMLQWVYAGHRRIQGLVNRRAAEVKLCLTGD